MANSLKSKIKKLRYQCRISDFECDDILSKLEGHDLVLEEKLIKQAQDTIRDYFSNYIDIANKKKEVDLIEEMLTFNHDLQELLENIGKEKSND